MLRYPIPFLALTFAAALVAATHTPAGRCDSDGAPALGIVEITTGHPSATFYVDDRGALLLGGNDVWIYMEDNGVWTAQGPGIHTGDVTNHNLQRGYGNCLFVCEAVEPPCTDVGDWALPDLPIY